MIFRSRAGMVTLAAVLVAAGLLAGVAVVSARSTHEAALAAATSSNPDPNAALPHSPRLLKQLAVNPMTTTAPGPQGVDVASFQHPNGAAIDWSQVAGAGYKFAWVKATEGNYYINKYFATDIAGAATNGLYPAAYHFAIPNVTTGANQADYLLATAAGSVNGTTPQIGLDIEYDPNISSDGTNICYGMTASQLVSWITAFSNEIRREAGQSPVIYTTADWWNTCTGDSTAFPAYQLWIASAPSATTGGPTLPAAWSSWTFWQYTSQGTVPGITGNVDLDYFNSGAGTMSNPGSQTGTVGAPVWLQMHALVGSSPFKATGLPPGLSLNTTTGLISGWLTKAGGYTVSVSDSATGTAPIASTGTTVTFTWTVNPAPNSGPTGRVVLAYDGKCMDDPGYRTANGTRVDLWTCNGGGNQNWTMAQDRTVRISGKCLDAANSATTNGTPVVLYTCNGSSAEQWRIAWHGLLVNLNSGKCLDDPGYRTANGTLLDIWTCGTGSNQRWTTPAGPTVSQIAPLCVDVAGANTADGTRMDVWPCNGHANQSFTVKPDGTIRALGKCLDVHSSGTANGTAVDLYSCNGTAGQQWISRADGTLLNPNSGRCLTDPGDSAQQGTRLVIFDCSAAGGEDWRIR